MPRRELHPRNAPTRACGTLDKGIAVLKARIAGGDLAAKQALVEINEIAAALLRAGATPFEHLLNVHDNLQRRKQVLDRYIIQLWSHKTP
jgi:hypothetical protein